MKTVEIRQGDGVTQIELMHLAATGSVGDVLSQGHIPGQPGRPSAPSAGSLNKALSQFGNAHPQDQPPAP